MRWPIKLNQEALPRWCRKFIPAKGDPRKLLQPDSEPDSFECCISSIKIDSTWKSTRKQRQILSDRLIVEAASSMSMPTVLEIGASSGSTSMELLDSLGDNFTRYYVTDVFFDLKCVTRNGVTYFYHPLTGECIMRVTDRFLVYKDVRNAIFPLGMIANRLITNAPHIGATDTTILNFLHPELRLRIASDARIIVTAHNIHDPWAHEMLDIVKVANVFNRLYFSDAEILNALTNLKTALKSSGKLVITDNRDIEMVSMFYMSEAGSFVLEKEINGGTSIAELVKRC